MITAQEVIDIKGASYSESSLSDAVTGIPSFLYDNPSSYGYWTSSPKATSTYNVWTVYPKSSSGSLDAVMSNNGRGIRPVITINASEIFS